MVVDNIFLYIGQSFLWSLGISAVCTLGVSLIVLLVTLTSPIKRKEIFSRSIGENIEIWLGPPSKKEARAMLETDYAALRIRSEAMEELNQLPKSLAKNDEQQLIYANNRIALPLRVEVLTMYQDKTSLPTTRACVRDTNGLIVETFDPTWDEVISQEAEVSCLVRAHGFCDKINKDYEHTGTIYKGVKEAL